MAWRSFQSFNFQDRFIRHQKFLGELTPIQENSNLDRMDATFNLEWVDESRNLVRFRSYNYPNSFLRHQDFRIKLHADNPADPLMQADSTFVIEPGLAYPYGWEFVSFRCTNPNLSNWYIRHANFHLYISSINPNDELGRKDATFRITNPAILWPR